MAVEVLVLQVDNRIGIFNGTDEKTTGIAWERGVHNLEPWHMAEDRFEFFRMMRAAPEAPPARCPYSHRHGVSRTKMNRRGVVDQLVQSGIHEIEELHFDDRP